MKKMRVPKKRILIVDDEPGYAEVVKVILEETYRYEVEIETSAEHALQTAKRYQPDLILLDLTMPGVPGGEVANRLLNDPETSRVPIIFLTAAVRREESESRGGLIGGRRFLSKMLPLADIQKALDQFWETPGGG